MNKPDVTDVDELIRDAAARIGSEYKLAKAMKIPQSHISMWKSGARACTPEDQARLAMFAGKDGLQALVKATLKRNAGTTKGEQLMQALGKWLPATGGAAILLISASAGFLAPSDARAAVRASVTTMYIMLNQKVI